MAKEAVLESTEDLTTFEGFVIRLCKDLSLLQFLGNSEKNAFHYQFI